MSVRDRGGNLRLLSTANLTMGIHPTGERRERQEPALQPDRAPLSFTVTTRTTVVTLEDGHTSVEFTVTNTTTRRIDGSLFVKPVAPAPAPAEWLTLAGDASRMFEPGAIHQVAVTVQVPVGTAEGERMFRLDAQNVDSPDEDYTEGPTVAIAVPKPAERTSTWRRYWWVLVIAVVLLGGIAAAVALRTSPDPTPDLLRSHVATLERDPGAWKPTLQDLVRELDDAESSTEPRVAAILQDTQRQATAGGCLDAFVGRRVVEKLRGVLHEVDPASPAPALVPVVCRTDPAASVSSASTKRLSYYGMDLTGFGERHPFAAVLRYGDGTLVASPFGKVDVISDTELQLTLAGADYASVVAARAPEIVLTWNSAVVQNDDPQGRTALPVELPLRYLKDRVRVSGTVRLWDNDSIDSDEEETFNVDASMTVYAGRDTTFSWSRCIDDEVSGYVDVTVRLDAQSGQLDALGSVRYYESDSCDKSDLQDEAGVNFSIPPAASGLSSSHSVNKDLDDSQGGVYVKLVFDRRDECTSRSPTSACSWDRGSR